MKMDRIIAIIMILLERKRVSVPELAKICEVTPRTIQRDLEAINLAGVPVVSFPGLGAAWASWRTTSWKSGCFPRRT